MDQVFRQKICFNEGWKFFHGDSGEYYESAFDDSGWKSVILPHDWSVEYLVDEKAPSGSGGGYAAGGVGWYRKKFIVPETNGKTILQFDGIFQDSTVYLNGQKAGGWAYGYSEFTVDITGKTVKGDNVLAIKVDNSRQPNSRWYTGSGIYRNVYLLKLNDVHIRQNGLYIATNGLYDNQTKARLQIQTSVQNEGTENVDVIAQHHVLDAEGREVAVESSSVSIEAGGQGRAMVMPILENPRLWSDKDPYLYTVETVLLVDSRQVDSVSTRIGIRTAEFDCDRGFLLNGTQVKIKGMCLHHDCGLTGAASYREIWERRLKLLKNMGCNGIRTAHNPPAVELLDLCDKLGFLVMDEAFDEWLLTKHKSIEYGYSSKSQYGYSQFFNRDSDADLVTMLHRDRNHPSIVLWSVGNEIPEQASVEGVSILRYLQDICHREDPTRCVCLACDQIAAPEPQRVTEAFENTLDVVGYNYTARWGIRAETLYDEDRRKFPKRRMIGAENPSAGGIRAFYVIRSNEKFFRLDYDMVTHNNEFLWRYTASRDFVAGDYLWTGIDYLGEARWPFKNAVSGPIDTAGFPKDTFYYFKSIWNKNDITLHLLPHWNWMGREGEFIPVLGYTNCDSVSLYLNGRLVGTKGYDFPNVGALGAWNIRAKNSCPTTHDLHLQWDVPYEAGELKAVGFIEGKPVAEQIVKTTGVPVKLNAAADRSIIPRFGIAHVEIDTLDKDGLFVPDASIPVSARVEGCACLLGLDSGDPRDLVPFYSPERKMLGGRLLCIIRGMEKGNAKLTLSASGMSDIILSFSIE
jgi:beta-galactosidase